MEQEEGTDELGTEKPLEERPKRKRIPVRKPMAPIEEDPLEFKQNKSSPKAKRIYTEDENVTIELWFDKHYHDRDQHGDDFGKRDGIDNDVVESLVKRSIKHMILYSTLVKGFTFLNKDYQPHERPLRIVLQEQTEFGLLNVVIEAHFIEIDYYEITVKTAMCKDDYKPFDNQYTIELDGDGSILSKCDMKKVNEVYRI